MTELVEYSLVVMVSTLFVAGSVATYGAFTSFESGLQYRAEFAAVSGLASQAIEDGSAKAAVSLPSSTIACEGGKLTVSAGPMTEGQSLPVGCNFTIDVSGGPHVIRFTENSSQLVLSVT